MIALAKQNLLVLLVIFAEIYGLKKWSKNNLDIKAKL